MAEPLVPATTLRALRRSYDAVADNYVAMGVGDLAAETWLRAVLDGFAERVRSLGPVLDAGCGPGQISAYLHDRGVDVRGIDLSPRMVEHARRSYPHIAFDAVSVTHVDLAPGSLGGVLGWWSWFNLPREVLPRVVTRIAAALRPGGPARRRHASRHRRRRPYRRLRRRSRPLDDPPLRARRRHRDGRDRRPHPRSRPPLPS